MAEKSQEELFAEALDYQERATGCRNSGDRHGAHALQQIAESYLDDAIAKEEKAFVDSYLDDATVME